MLLNWILYLNFFSPASTVLSCCSCFNVLYLSSTCRDTRISHFYHLWKIRHHNKLMTRAVTEAVISTLPPLTDYCTCRPCSPKLAFGWKEILLPLHGAMLQLIRFSTCAGYRAGPIMWNVMWKSIPFLPLCIVFKLPLAVTLSESLFCPVAQDVWARRRAHACYWLDWELTEEVGFLPVLEDHSE